MIRENQRLYIVNTDATSVLRQPDGYCLRSSTNIWWRDKLASWCWDLMHKLRALEPYSFSETIYTYTPSQQKEITDRLMEGIDLVFRRGEDIENYCIVLGDDDFSEMMQSPPMSRMMTFATTNIRYQNSHGHRLEYYGLPVHVIPNISGAALIPKVIVEKDKPKLGAS